MWNLIVSPYWMEPKERKAAKQALALWQISSAERRWIGSWHQGGGELQHVIQWETQETDTVTDVFQWPLGWVPYLSSCRTWSCLPNEEGQEAWSLPTFGWLEGKVNIYPAFWLVNIWNPFPCLDLPTLCLWKSIPSTIETEVPDNCFLGLHFWVRYE